MAVPLTKPYLVTGNIIKQLVTHIKNAVLPVGSIIMFKNSTIPTGWAICNGSNGTPDLRDRFVIGAGSSYSLNGSGTILNDDPAFITDNSSPIKYYSLYYIMKVS